MIFFINLENCVSTVLTITVIMCLWLLFLIFCFYFIKTKYKLISRGINNSQVTAFKLAIDFFQ